MTSVCKVCEAAHAMCLSGDAGAQAADFLKAAIVQERKAKEKAEAEAAKLRAEVERLNGILDAERELSSAAMVRMTDDLAAARAALAKEREACDAWLRDCFKESVHYPGVMEVVEVGVIHAAHVHRARRAAEAKPLAFGECGRAGCRAVSGQVNHGYCRSCRLAAEAKGAT